MLLNRFDISGITIFSSWHKTAPSRGQHAVAKVRSEAAVLTCETWGLQLRWSRAQLDPTLLVLPGL